MLNLTKDFHNMTYYDYDDYLDDNKDAMVDNFNYELSEGEGELLQTFFDEFFTNEVDQDSYEEIGDDVSEWILILQAAQQGKNERFNEVFQKSFDRFVEWYAEKHFDYFDFLEAHG